MDERLVDGLMTALAPLVKEHVAREIAKAREPLVKSDDDLELRIVALEQKAPIPGIQGERGEAGPQGEKGEDAPAPSDEQIQRALSPERLKEAIALTQFDELVQGSVQKWLEANPPRDGKDGEPGADAPAPTIEFIAEAVMTTPGFDSVIDAAIEARWKASPPKDGSDGKEGVPGKDGERGPPGDIAFAPPDLAENIASAVRLLHESPPIQIASHVSQPPIINLDVKGAHTKRTWIVERDENNRMTKLHEEAAL